MSQKKKNRKRGIQASRSKLTKALFAAGMKTQAALAEKIAEHEQLNSAPKDLVNRVFNEQSVDPNTLERIAAVLEVPAHTLYLSSEEQAAQEAASNTDNFPAQADPTQSNALGTAESSIAAEPNPAIQTDSNRSTTDSALEQPSIVTPKKGPKRRYWPWGAALATVTALVFIWLLQASISQTKPQTDSATQPKSVAIVIKDQGLETLVDHLSKQLPGGIRRVTVAQALINPPGLSANVADQFQADAVLTFSLYSVSRYQFTQIYYYHQGQQTQIAAIHHTEDELNNHPELIAPALLQAVTQAFNGNTANKGLELAEQKDFLHARQALEDRSSELKIKRAQSLLTGLLKTHPNFSLAYAGLCQAAVLESWMGNEKSLLQQAEEYCVKALQQDSDNPFAGSAYGHVLARTGRAVEAIGYLNQLLQRWPNNVDALVELAQAELSEYHQKGSEQKHYLTQATEHLELATQLSPRFAKIFTDLSSAYFLNGRMLDMIRSLEQGLALEENFTSRFNLNTAYMCVGEPVKALQVALESSSPIEESYLRDEMLGRGYYYNGDFKKAVAHISSAIKNVGTGEMGIQQMWGELADAQRHLGSNENAIDSYRKAITVIQRDDLRGNSNYANQVFHAYYFQMLNLLDANQYPQTMAPFSLDKLVTLLEENPSVSGFFRLAILFNLMQQPTLSLEALTAATDRCPGYNRNPDYAALVDQAGLQPQ
ncbi:tetratricopeptide repeat protein [Halioxenophilus aromaticivorans]|uniref:HTH cro/C1-type domain-containing protein n=1 Tax=Halioxenophilus aromaticivorans TaxID=1306992 RepID=A0AAV3TY06_9ALTE